MGIGQGGILNTNKFKGVRYLAIALIGGLVLAWSAQAASFDCAKAQSKVEHLICDNPKISVLDSKLGQDYRDVLGKANNEQKQHVTTEQKHWLKFTRDFCNSLTCLKHAYWSRQAELETYFEPKSPLYKHESDKAEAIKQVLATAPLYPSYDTPFCRGIFDDLREMKGIHLVDPVAQAQSYEDPVFDPWKKQCRGAPPFNFSYQCDRNIVAADADDLIDGCDAGYGLPPFKLYELPPAGATGEKRYFFYADDAYGPMNRDWRKPILGGGFAGFQQINITQCLSLRGNRWERTGKKSSWNGMLANAGQGERNGKNYNSIFEYKKQYYFLVLHEVRNNYWLDIEPTAFNIHPTVCRWSPVKR
jgi:uncharacterized protein